MPSGNDRKPADLNSEEAAVRSRNVAATQNFACATPGMIRMKFSRAAWEVAINPLAEGKVDKTFRVACGPSSPPILLRLSLHRSAGRVFHLEPSSGRFCAAIKLSPGLCAAEISLQ
jgi:hypothetical protein